MTISVCNKCKKNNSNNISNTRQLNNRQAIKEEEEEEEEEYANMPIAKCCVGASMIGENGDWTIVDNSDDDDGNSNSNSNSNRSTYRNTVIPVANYVTTIEHGHHHPGVITNDDVCSSCGCTSSSSSSSNSCSTSNTTSTTTTSSSTTSASSSSHVVQVSDVSLVSDEDVGALTSSANGSSCAFDIPSVRCFVTDEDEARNREILRQQQQLQQQLQQEEVQYQEQPPTQTQTQTQPPVKTITGTELLARLKRNRKQATVRSGVIGGIVGLFLLGPIGAVGCGVGSAILTKHRLKKREKTLRKQLEGRIDQPLPVVSTSPKACSCPRGRGATNCTR